jgi:hypothetical protein
VELDDKDTSQIEGSDGDVSTSPGTLESFDNMGTSVDPEREILYAMLLHADRQRLAGMHERVGRKLIHHTRMQSYSQA